MARIRMDAKRLDALLKPTGREPKARKAKKPRIGPTETSVSASVQEYLDAIRVFTFRVQSGRVMVLKGEHKHVMHLAPTSTADRIGHLPDGRFLGIEVKRPDQWPSKEQIEWMRERNDSGAVAFWVNGLPNLKRIMTHVLGGGSIEVDSIGQVHLK